MAKSIKDLQKEREQLQKAAGKSQRESTTTTWNKSGRAYLQKQQAQQKEAKNVGGKGASIVQTGTQTLDKIRGNGRKTTVATPTSPTSPYKGKASSKSGATSPSTATGWSRLYNDFGKITSREAVEEAKGISDLNGTISETADSNSRGDTRSLPTIGTLSAPSYYAGRVQQLQSQIRQLQKQTNASDSAGYTGLTARLRNSSANEELSKLQSQLKAAQRLYEQSNRQQLQNATRNAANSYNGLSSDARYSKASDLAGLSALGGNVNQTVYGNIDTNNRNRLVWDDATLEANEEALMSWNRGAKNFDEVWNQYSGSYSTVDGRSGNYGGVDVGFTPILNDGNNAYYMDQDTVTAYINAVIAAAKKKSATGEVSEADVLAIDKAGLSGYYYTDSNGRKHKIKGIIAGTGQNGITAASTMHYVGKDGSIADANSRISNPYGLTGAQNRALQYAIGNTQSNQANAQNIANAGNNVRYAVAELGNGIWGAGEDTAIQAVNALSSAERNAMQNAARQAGYSTEDYLNWVQMSYDNDTGWQKKAADATRNWNNTEERTAANQLKYNPDALGKFAGETANMIGNMAPSMVITAVTGGLAGGGQAASAISQILGYMQFGAAAAGAGTRQAASEMGLNNRYANNTEDWTTAQNYGVLSGVKEVFTELLFGGMQATGEGILDALTAKADSAAAKAVVSLTNKMGKSGAANFLNGILKSPFVEKLLDAGEEGLEEVIGDLIEPVLQWATYNPDVMENGYLSAIDAENMGKEFVMAAISSGIFGGAAEIINTPANIEAGKQYVGENVENGVQLIQQALSLPEDSDARRYAEWLTRKTDTTSAGEMGQLADLVGRQSARTMGKLARQYSNDTAEIRHNEEIERYNKRVESIKTAKATVKEKITNSTVQGSVNNAIRAAIVGEEVSYGDASTILTDEEAKADLESRSGMDINNVHDAQQALRVVAENYMSDAAYAADQSTVIGKRATASMNAAVTSAATAARNVTASEGQIVVKSTDENGKATYSAQNVEEANLTNEQKTAANEAVRMGAGQHYTEYQTAVDLAAGGLSYEKMQGNALFSNLTEEQLKSAHTIGAETFRSNLAKSGRSRSLGTGTVSDNGGIVDGVTYKAVSSEAKSRADYKAAKSVASVLAKTTGLHFVFFESEANADGKITATANGMYQDSTGTIYIDVNATKGKVTDTAVMGYTMSHEMTHWLKQASPEQYQRMQEFVLNQMGAETVNRLVAQHQAEEKLDYDGAIEEIIANSCEGMLRDSKAIRQLAQQDKTLFEKIKDWIDKFAENVRRMYSGRGGTDNGSTEEGRTALAYIDELQKLWDSALTEAVSAEENAEPVAINEDEAIAANDEVTPEMIDEMGADVAFSHRITEDDVMYNKDGTSTNTLEYLHGLVPADFANRADKWWELPEYRDNVILTYRSMAKMLVNGKWQYYPPMASFTKDADGNLTLEDGNDLKTWEGSAPLDEPLNGTGPVGLLNATLDGRMQWRKGSKEKNAIEKLYGEEIGGKKRVTVQMLSEHGWLRDDGQLDVAALQKDGIEAYFLLKKADGTDCWARYNPYMHSSNSTLNDQFKGAWKRPELVTVMCVVPRNESNGNWNYEAAKDATGWADWNSGSASGAAKNAGKDPRRLFLSRYILPFRELTPDEVAQSYKEILTDKNGKQITEVSDKVVNNDLLEALKRAGVKVKTTGEVEYAAPSAEYERLAEAAWDAYSKDFKLKPTNGKINESKTLWLPEKVIEQMAKSRGIVKKSSERQTEVSSDREATVYDNSGNEVAESYGNGEVKLSLRTYRETGRDVLEKYLNAQVKKKAITEEEKTEMLSQMDEMYDLLQGFNEKGTYAPFSEWSEADVVPLRSAIVQNNEYSMNIDFSLVCKKRRTLDAVLNELCRNGDIERLTGMVDENASEEERTRCQREIVNINAIIREYGFETACALCFVDSKRFRNASIADSLVTRYNAMVKDLNRNSKYGIDYFNFAGSALFSKKSENPLQNISKEEAAELFKGSEAEKVLGTIEYKANGKAKSLNVEQRIARHLRDHPEDWRLLARGDFMSTAGFDAVNTINPNIMTIFNSSKGSAGPKASYSDVQYQGDVQNRQWKVANAYKVGGVRMQSFSDYVPRMVFDYLQAFRDLSIKKLPAHAYTKEELFVKQFGLTGMKINMSLVPKVAKGGIAAGLDANGNYAWAGESFNYETAKQIQADPAYSKNCGTICVGVSYQHIMKLLRDPTIRMVIPYHKSGLNPVVAHMNRIAEFTDYTNYQNTRYANGTKLEKKDAAKEPKYNALLRKYGDPKKAANAYLEWCDKNNYLPRFDQFRGEENYYKLLTDFAVYDEDGNYTPQGAVTFNFPGSDSAFGSFSELVQRGLEEDAILEGQRDKYCGEIAKNVKAAIDAGTIADEDFDAKSVTGTVKNSSERQKQRRESYENPAVTINDSGVKYTDMIFAENAQGRKTIETRRGTKNGEGPLDEFIGKRVAIIRTGKGTAKNAVVGYVTITGKKVYHTPKEFRGDFNAHRVPSKDSYDFPENGTKVGYIMSDPAKLDNPVLVGNSGYVADDRGSRGLDFTEKDAVEGKKNNPVSSGVRYSFRDTNIERVFAEYGSDEAAQITIDKATDLRSRGKIVRITSSDVKGAKDKFDARDKNPASYIKSVISLAAGTGSFYFKIHGRTVEAYLSRNGKNHFARYNVANAENAAIAEKFGQLIENSEYAYSTNDSKHGNAQNINGWDRFVTAVDVDGEKYFVEFVVREDEADVRSQIYHVLIKKEDTSGTQAVAALKNGAGDIANYPVIVSSGNNIPQDTEDGKSGNKKSSKYEKIRYSYAGRKSVTAPMETIDQAEKMLSEGKDSEEILYATGWFVGMDGKLKYEISNRGFQIIREKYEEIRNSGKVMRLEDFVSGADNLFAAYPSLADVKVNAEPLGMSLRGYHQRGKITLNSALTSTMLRKTLIHEIQHEIQSIEGFAGGTNSRWVGLQKNWFNELSRLNGRKSAGKRFLKEGFTTVKINGYLKEFRNLASADPNSYSIYNEMEEIASDDTMPEFEIDELIDELRDGLSPEEFEAVGALEDLAYSISEELDKLLSRKDYDIYVNSAGEIEAEDVANRIDLTDTERTWYLPNPGDENTVLLKYSRARQSEQIEKLREEVAHWKAQTKPSVDSQKIARQIVKAYPQGSNGISTESIADSIREIGKAALKAKTETTDRNDMQTVILPIYKKASDLATDIVDGAVVGHDQTYDEYYSHFRGFYPGTYRKDILNALGAENVNDLIASGMNRYIKFRRSATGVSGADVFAEELADTMGLDKTQNPADIIAEAVYLMQSLEQKDEPLFWIEEESNEAKKEVRQAILTLAFGGKAEINNTTLQLRDAEGTYADRRDQELRETIENYERLLKAESDKAQSDSASIRRDERSRYEKLLKKATEEAHSKAEARAKKRIDELKKAREADRQKAKEQVAKATAKGERAKDEALRRTQRDQRADLMSLLDSKGIEALSSGEATNERLQKWRDTYREYQQYLSDAAEYAAIAREDGITEDQRNMALNRAAVLRQKADATDERLAKLEKGDTMKKLTRMAMNAARDKQAAEDALHQQEVRQRAKEKRDLSKLQKQLLSISRRLMNKKLPEVTKAGIAELVGDLDLQSIGLTNKTIENLSGLYDWYTELKTRQGDNFISIPSVENKLARLRKKHISDLTAEEALNLVQALQAIENDIRTRNKLIADEDQRNLEDIRENVVHNIKQAKGPRDTLAADMSDFIITQTLAPMREMHRITGYNEEDPLWKATQKLNQGAIDEIGYNQMANHLFDKWTNDRKFMKWFTGKHAAAIEITGYDAEHAGMDSMDERNPGMIPTVTAKITPAMRMSLYLHSLNDENMRHMKYGGVTIPDYDLYRKGKFAKAYSEGTRMKLERRTIDALCADMTPQEREMAAEVSRYFNTVSKSYINDVSLNLVGYELASVDNYYPINVDSNFLASDFESLKKDGTIEGMGILKERVMSRKPIMLRPVDEVLSQNIRMHGRYYGLAIPVRNFNKIYRAADNVDHTTSVQAAVDGKWHDNGKKYIEKFMAELQGNNTPAEGFQKYANIVQSNAAGAILSMNISVAMKQAGSYPTAGSVLGFAPLAKAMKDITPAAIKGIRAAAQKGYVDPQVVQMAKYTHLYEYRSGLPGVSDMADWTGTAAKLLTTDWLNWITDMDLLTTKTIWNASQYYVEMNEKDFEKGSEEFWKEVGRIYDKVIQETQPNYTVMQRPQILRNTGFFDRILGMFKTQTFQNFNILYDAVEDYKSNKTKETAKTLRRAVVSQFVQLVTIATMTAVYAGLKGNFKKRYGDDDENVTFKTFAARFFRDWLSGIGGMIPGGSELMSLLGNWADGTSYDIMSSTQLDAANEMLSGVQKIGSTIAALVQSLAKHEDINWHDTAITLEDASESIVEFTGIPAGNIHTLISMMLYHTIGTRSGLWGQYLYSNLTGSYSDNKATYYSLLYQAMQDDPDVYSKLCADIENRTSIEADTIESKMRSMVQDGYENGTIDADTAVKLWQTFLDSEGEYQDEDAAYWLIAKWDDTKAYADSHDGKTTDLNWSRYYRLEQAIEADDLADAKTAVNELLEHGVDADKLKNKIGDWTKGDEKTEPILDDELADSLLNLAGYNDAQIDEIIGSWDFYKDYGFSYSDLRDAYAGEIEGISLTENETISILENYGGKSEEDALDKLNEYKCYVEYGITPDSVKESYTDPTASVEIDRNTAAEILSKYKGKTDEEVSETLEYYDYVKDNVGTEVTQSAYTAWGSAEKSKSGTAPKDSGIDVETFYAAYHYYNANDGDVGADGKTASGYEAGSKQTKYVNYLSEQVSSGAISATEADILFLWAYKSNSEWGRNLPW